jgi:hypothetical protein
MDRKSGTTKKLNEFPGKYKPSAACGPIAAAQFPNRTAGDILFI